MKDYEALRILNKLLDNEPIRENVDTIFEAIGIARDILHEKCLSDGLKDPKQKGMVNFMEKISK